MSERIMYIPTLPSTFNSLVGKTVKIETEEPRYLIELLGDLLGVEDYETNKAAFWFLDTIALQLVRYKNCLDDHYKSVLISWLAGEIKLIRDRKLSREDFFKEMKIIFSHVAEDISSGDQLSHWELIVDKYSKNILTEEIEPPLSTKRSSDSENSLQGKTSKNVQTPSNVEDSKIDAFPDTRIAESSDSASLNVALDAIIDATYSMYANELRYALIHAVFVTPIQLQIYHMPHTLRTPRQVKVADPEGSFEIRLLKRLEKIAHESTIGNGKKPQGKITFADAKRERAIEEDLDTEVPPTPPSSLTDEEILADNRRFILPLIEAEEAAQIFAMHAESTKQE